MRECFTRPSLKLRITTITTVHSTVFWSFFNEILLSSPAVLLEKDHQSLVLLMLTLMFLLSCLSQLLPRYIFSCLGVYSFSSFLWKLESTHQFNPSRLAKTLALTHSLTHSLSLTRSLTHSLTKLRRGPTTFVSRPLNSSVLLHPSLVFLYFVLAFEFVRTTKAKHHCEPRSVDFVCVCGGWFSSILPLRFVVFFFFFLSFFFLLRSEVLVCDERISEMR